MGGPYFHMTPVREEPQHTNTCGTNPAGQTADPSHNRPTLSTSYIEPQPNSVQTTPTSHPTHCKDNPQQSEPKSVINSLPVPAEPTSHPISPVPPLSSPTFNPVSMQSQPSAPSPPELISPPIQMSPTQSPHIF